MGGPLAINGGAGPVVRPCDVPVLAQRDHRLDGECHARFAFTDGLVLGIMRHVGRAVEELVDAVATVRADDTAVLLLGVLLNDIAKLPYQDARLDRLDGLFEALARGLDDSHVVRVRLCLVTNVVRLVEIGMVAFVVERDVNVENVAIDKYALIGNAVADDFVD